MGDAYPSWLEEADRGHRPDEGLGEASNMNHVRISRRFALAVIGILLVALLPGAAAAAGTHYFLVTAPVTALAGSAQNLTVEVRLVSDDTVDAAYTGIVDFSSSDGNIAVALPALYAFTGLGFDDGSHTFTGELTLATVGNQTVTVTEPLDGSTGASSGTAVTPAAANHLVVSAPGTASVGTPFSVTVTALDQYGNTATDYAGTLHFTSSDGAALLPADSMLTAGVGTFSVTLVTAGTQSVTATDTVTSSVTGSQTGIEVQSLTPATFHALTPTRILDTRDGTGGLSGPVSSHVARTFAVTGHGGVPSNATAVTGNLTVTGQTSLGFLSIGPIAMNNPTSSTLNFPLGDDRANAVTVALSGTGTLSITYAAPTLGPTAHVIFDVTGYFTPDTTGATYHPLSPARILDTRDGTGGLSGKFSSHVARTFQVSGRGGVPSSATAVTGNLTVTGQTSLGYLYLGPVPKNNPTSSTLNFPLGDDRANAVTVALGAGGALSVTYAAPMAGPTADVIFDVTGYFTPDTTGAKYVPLTPSRILDSRDGTGGLSGAFSSHIARTFTVIGHGGVPSGAVAVTGNLTVTGQTSLGFLSIGPAAQNDPTSSTLNFPLNDDRANAVAVALGGDTLSVTYAAPRAGPTAHVIFDVTGYFVP
jgi:hypothetical protein